jgi:hypothetical protein
MISLSDMPKGSNAAGHNGRQVQTMELPKLKFDRVTVSLKMTDIVEKLKPICSMVSPFFNLGLRSSKFITTTERPITSEESMESKLYGREFEKERVVHAITHGEYSASEITVLPIVGLGGIGKTTMAQHIYKQVKSHFQVTMWICVSLKFNVDRLWKEASEKLPERANEKKYGTTQELIEQRLTGERFLLVLDDIWECHEDEWQKLLTPFRKGGGKGSMVIVTSRSGDVAKIVRTTDYQIELGRLGDKDFRDLFCACVSTSQEPWSDHPELLEIGNEIIPKLKGSPLAAKTVGRVLRKHITLEHWRRVLECKEWELQSSEYDIMPALKISYDYLPLHLKQCFSYCALFPEDYEFDSKELIQFWIGLGALSPGRESTRIEDVGKSSIINLVNHGFLKMYERDNGDPYYVIHDLLHELAVKVSGNDCVSIKKISELRYIHIPASVRHLSIMVDNNDFKDKVTYKNREEDLSSLDKKLKVKNLHTLMLFGENVECFSKTFGNLFQQARALRIIFLDQPSYNVEAMLHNFSSLIHLRYLKIKGQHYFEMSLPVTISRLYHLKILDMEDCWGCFVPSRDSSNLINMHYLSLPDQTRYSDILKVGTMKLLRQLRRFEAKKEDSGFELKELGQLLELEVLGIYNLEKVKFKEDAEEAKLSQKKYLQELILNWDTDRLYKDTMQEDHILESLQPHRNLYRLSIKGHGGANCPSWLGVNLSVRTLEYLELTDIPWTNFPPLGEVWMVDEHGADCKSHMPGQRFQNLKRLELVNVSKLRRWVGNGPCELFSNMKVLIIKNCPELLELPFTHAGGHEKMVGPIMTCFPKLEELEITECPKLSSLPSIPWSSATRSVTIEQAGSGIERLSLREYARNRYIMDIEGKDAVDSAFWRVLSFHNLSNLGLLTIWGCPPLPLVHLERLSSLKALTIVDSSEAFCLSEDDGRVGYQCPVEDLTFNECEANGERLTYLLSCFPKLHTFNVQKCEKVTGFGVRDQQKKNQAHSESSPSSVNEVEEAQIVVQQQEQEQLGEEEITGASEGLLFLPPQLQDLSISDCSNLVLRPNSLNDGGGDLQCLRSLQALHITGCPRFLSSYSPPFPSCCPFPTSLDYLCLEGAVGAATLLPLSNLTSLTTLLIRGCGDLRGEGLWMLITEGRLTHLEVTETPNFFACSEPSLPSLPSKLESLQTDDIAKVLTVPICTLLSFSLNELNFHNDKKMECFTKEQEEALQLLTLLKGISFHNCPKLQGLPEGLHRLPNLQILFIYPCDALRSLPKYGLPSTLQELMIEGCQGLRCLPKNCLPSSLQKLKIGSCPSIRTIPKLEDLPSSLRELDVQRSESSELRRQCRKMIGSIPIVKA